MKLGENQLVGDDDENVEDEIYYQEENGKMVVQDFEGRDRKVQEGKRKRRTEGYGVDSDTDSDDEGPSKKVSSSTQLRKIIKN